jgi:hypothetical protein
MSDYIPKNNKDIFRHSRPTAEVAKEIHERIQTGEAFEEQDKPQRASVQAEMVRVNTRISKEINDWLDEQSASSGVPKSTLIFLALEQYMSHKKAANMLPLVQQLMADVERMKNSSN